MRALMFSLALLTAASAQDDKATPKVELKGCMKVTGTSFKLGQTTKYTGDTYLLKLAFTDENGVASQPTATMNFNVYNGQEPYKKVQRLVTKESWKADTAKINQQTVVDNTIAFDKKSGELWVAFVRADPGFDPRIDLTLDLKGVGSWVWKGIDLESKFEVAAKGPEKAEKK